MTTIKVKGIAPYPGLRDLLLELAEGDPRIRMDVEIADLQEALPIVRMAEQQQYDVIVSRGGTASVIRQHVSIPVVDIPVSGYDILRVLTLIKDSNSKRAIIGFPNICQGAATVSSLLNLEIPIYPITHESQVTSALQQAIEHGAQIVLGDVVTVRIARQMGYHGILITSGRESVLETLAEVKRVYDIYAKGREKSGFFEQLLQHAPTGIVAANGESEVEYANPAAQQWLTDGGKLPPALLPAVRENQGSQQEWEQVTLNDRCCRIKAVPRMDKAGYLLYFEPSETVLSVPARLVQTPSRLASFAQVIGSSPEIAKALKRAKAFAQTDKAVWLSGEPGAGKMHFAQSIHSAGEQNRYPFYWLACRGADRQRLERELFGTAEEAGLLHRAAGGTLYLEDVDALSRDVQERLVQEIRRGTRLRFIASSVVPLTLLAKRGNCFLPLLQLLGECHVKIPPLRERVEDIEEIARVLIAEHNSRYGKHIVGIREEVLERLMEHDWPGNVKELENVVEEMLLVTQGHYVGIPEWEDVWERYRVESGSCSAWTVSGQLDLSGTWEQIERQILLHVLKEEGMNQSKAAKRLGINRTTLWRKLQGMLQK
jgi:propionate catabolism operon transcriptional regulator